MSAQLIDLSIDQLIDRELPAAARGDRDAYGRIVAASQNTVTAVALAITRDVATSEDIAQEAFLSAWQQLRRLHNPSSFLPWLRQITRNLARDHLRTHRHRPLGGDGADIAIANAADPSPSPMQRLIEDEREATAAELISALPEDSREVLLLYYREGQSSQQVASLLGMSDAAVRKRLSRARQCVREDLLRRFGDFARGSAPGGAFVMVVTAALGTASKPVAAAGIVAAGSAATGKALLGSLGLAGGGLVGGAITLYISRRCLRRYADDAHEWQAIARCYDTYVVTSTIVVLGSILIGWVTKDMVLTGVAIVAGVAVLNYQLLGPLARIMNPLVRRDAERNPVGAERRQLIYRLTFGVSGVLISNIAVLGALAYLHLKTS